MTVIGVCDSAMNAYTITGQCLWFAFGAWAGGVLVELSEIIRAQSLRIHSMVDDGSMLPLLIALFIPLAVVMTVPFGGWLLFRSRRGMTRCAAPWLLPLVAGLLYLPLCGMAVPLLCALTAQSQGTRIAGAIVVLLFGLPVAFEDANSCVFKIGSTLINLLKTTAAGELIEPAAVASRESGSRLVFTIAVDDVDAMCAQLTARGVKLLNGPMDRPWGVRTASFIDPGGHIWEIAK